MRESNVASHPLHLQTPTLALAPLELGETRLREIVRRADDLDALWALARQASDGVPCRLPGCDLAESATLASEPHFLGWLHQHTGERRRQASFEAHVQRECKHAASTTTTQLYTPRWVADALARELYAVAGVSSLLDPACGGGQMLLAWVDTLIAHGVEPTRAFELVRGVDLDPAAVAVAREVLVRHGARYGVQVEPDLRAADALFAPIEPAELVLTNPPYMGRRSMDPALKTRISANFPNYDHDLYTAFILRSHQLATRAVGILAQQTIWYLSRFEAARRDLVERGDVTWFAHLGPRVFRSLSGEKANVVAFVQTTDRLGASTRVADLRELTVDAKREALAADRTTTTRLERFRAIPGAPIAHWLRTPLLQLFASDASTLADLVTIPGSQNKTGANRRFVKPFGEVEPASIRSAEGLWDGDADGRWVFYSKGGPFAPWWGNWHHVVDWSEPARAFYARNRTSNLLAEPWRFRPGLTYSDFGGQRFAARWLPQGTLIDMAGPGIFAPDDDENLLLGLMVVLNSEPVRELLNALNPSIHYQVRDLRNVPIPREVRDTIRALAPAGRALRDGYRALHADIEGDPLFGCEPVQATIEALRAIEDEAHTRVCDLFGVDPPNDLPTHHAFG